MKKILYIYHVSHIGGGSLCLLNLIREIDRNEFSPIVLLKSKGPLVKELENLDVHVNIENSITTVPYNRSLFTIGSIWQVISIIVSAYKIANWIKNIKPDIIHINTMMMYPYAILSKRKKIKTVIHIREHWPVNEHRIQLKLARKTISYFVDIVIAINNTSSRLLNLEDRTKIVYDWIDFTNRDGPVDFNGVFGTNYRNLKYFLFLGGMQRIKGAYEIVKSFSNLPYNKNLRLLFVGYASREYDKSRSKGIVKVILRTIGFPVYSDRIKRIAQQDNRIIFIPATTNVKELIRQSHCVISFPTIPHAIIPIAEAIWLEKPIISADTPEAREYSNNGKAAFLVEIKNEKELFNAMVYSLKNNRLMEIARIGSRAIQKKFDKSLNSKKLHNIYLSLLTN